MLLTAQYYQEQIDRVNKELTQAFKLLKRRKKLERKEVLRLQKRIKQLVETLTDLKYKASYLQPPRMKNLLY